MYLIVDGLPMIFGSMPLSPDTMYPGTVILLFHFAKTIYVGGREWRVSCLWVSRRKNSVMEMTGFTDNTNPSALASFTFKVFLHIN